MSMTTKILIEDFNHSIDFWIKELVSYNFSQLSAKPSANSWSLGQVYMHLIDDTHYYLGQIIICISADDHCSEEASPTAQEMFLHNDFPDTLIEGASSNALIPQPGSKEQLRSTLLQLKDEMNKAGMLIAESSYKGKTKHPGLHYFNAAEWLQFAGMHFRHHIRQKKRIDDFLKMSRQ